MASFFDRFRGRKTPSSAEIAKERLKLVLVTDRSNIAPEKLEAMQREIIEVIRRYIPIDGMEVQINIEQRERKHYLVADVPLNRDPNYGALEAPGPTPGPADDDPDHLAATRPHRPIDVEATDRFDAINDDADGSGDET